MPSRRLSRLEYEHTLHDLLGISTGIAKHLPPENASGSYDVIAAKQEMSSVHVRSYLRAADLALDEAIQLGARPNLQPRKLFYHPRDKPKKGTEKTYVTMWEKRPVQNGGGTLFVTENDVVTFRGENYIFRSDLSGFKPSVAGRYRVSIKAAPYQQRSSISVSLKWQNDAQGESGLFAAWDLEGDEYRTVSTEVYLRPDDYIYVSADELEPATDGKVIYNAKSPRQFGGEGVKIREVEVQGPLESSWPPPRTLRLFPGLKWDGKWLSFGHRRAYTPRIKQDPLELIQSSVSSIAPQAFRRPVSDEEIQQFVELARPGIEQDNDFIDTARIPLRALLVSPQALFLTGPAGELDEHALASRLSYFLWRSMPDQELSDLAKAGKLSDPKVLAHQVDRMLDDPKSERFVTEFLDQWLDLDMIDATTPDPFMFPEYDDVLRAAMLGEVRAFFRCLIDEDLSSDNLIDSDFVMLNRKLAEHYQIEGVKGEQMRKVKLPEGSVRGGLLAQAAIAKVTANGTTTSPVKRGNFVLTNFLGQPPQPPPANAGSIEPDTRGFTKIRELLEKHQELPTCAACHQFIDPPGFALEVFGPIGIHRERYRNSIGVKREHVPGLRLLHKEYAFGARVDASGVTVDGAEFEDFKHYKRVLLANHSEQVARNLLRQLIAFSTGAEVQFADREEVERILHETSAQGFPVRSLIHQVVNSRMFRNR